MTTPAKPRLLIIDDEVQIRRLLQVTLEEGGFDVREADTGRTGLSEAAALQPEAIILDLGLPDMDGLDVLRRLREWSQTPVLVLTVRDREQQKIAALDAAPNEPAIVKIGEIEMDLPARVVRRAGVEVHLTAKEYAVLRLLVQHRGKVVTHRQILRELWGPNAEENTGYLRVYMLHLRQKLEADPQKPKHLTTESGIGYRLVEG
jgi:two-component system KDP operon response regulator KdpE